MTVSELKNKLTYFESIGLGDSEVMADITPDSTDEMIDINEVCAIQDVNKEYFIGLFTTL